MLSFYFEDDSISKLLNLHPSERLFVYYMSMAAMKGYNITLNQLCPYPNLLDEIWQILLRVQPSQLRQELGEYWIYLFTNYGVYFIKEDHKNKKTPEMLGLHSITADSLQQLGLNLTSGEKRYLFDCNFKPNSVVPNDIEKSGYTFYGAGMNNKHIEGVSKNFG